MADIKEKLGAGCGVLDDGIAPNKDDDVGGLVVRLPKFNVGAVDAAAGVEECCVVDSDGFPNPLNGLAPVPPNPPPRGLLDPRLPGKAVPEAGAEVVAVLAPPSDNVGVDDEADAAGADPNKFELC